jgi:chaperonin GroES
LDNGSRAPIDVKVGDVVYFTKYAPDELDVDGKKYLVVKQSSILAKQG